MVSERQERRKLRFIDGYEETVRLHFTASNTAVISYVHDLLQSVLNSSSVLLLFSLSVYGNCFRERIHYTVLLVSGCNVLLLVLIKTSEYNSVKAHARSRFVRTKTEIQANNPIQ